MTALTLELVPVSRAVANDAVTRWHRHRAPVPGDLFRVGVAADGTLVAVGIAGRPVSRVLDDGRTVEVTRVSSSGAPNACSMLYGALARAAFALGYSRVVTYTGADESGASLRGAGWRVVAQRRARPDSWHTVARPRPDARHETRAARTLWEAPLPH